MEEDDPRRNMPIMYQRQEEIRDPAKSYYGQGPNFFSARKVKAKVDPKLKKRQTLRKIILIANIVLIAGVLIFFINRPLDQVQLKTITLNTSARIFEKQVLISATFTLGEDSIKSAGELVQIWIWMAQAPGIFQYGSISVPDNALFVVDVLPQKKGETLVFRERLSVAEGVDLKNQRVYISAEYPEGHLQTITEIKAQ